MDTWGISGSQFLVMYGAALVLGVLLVFAIRRRISGESDRSGLVGLRAPELGPYEAAMVKGGDSLVVAVAACRLKEIGSLGVAGAGSLEVAGPLPASSDPVEDWVYSVVQHSPVPKAVLNGEAAAVV